MYYLQRCIHVADDRLLPVNQRQRVFSNGTLLILDMQPGVDDGIYSCEVLPGQGIAPVSRSFRVYIKSKFLLCRMNILNIFTDRNFLKWFESFFFSYFHTFYVTER